MRVRKKSEHQIILQRKSNLLPIGTSKNVKIHFQSLLVQRKLQIFKIDSAQHEDFGCLPQLVKETGNCKPSQYYKNISKLTISFLEDHLKDRNSFAKKIERE